MVKEKLSAVAEKLAAEDPRYRAEAYVFISEAVGYTVAKLPVHRHVTAVELVAGVREFAVVSFGGVARMVCDDWGIFTSSDIGELVYALIAAGMLSASPEDRREDFDIDVELFPSESDTPGEPVPVPRID